MGLFGNGNKKTSLYHIEGLPTGFKYVTKLELDNHSQKLIFHMVGKEEREISYNNLIFARREQIIDNVRGLKGLSLKIGYKSTDGVEKELVFLFSPTISNGFNGFAKELEKLVSNGTQATKEL